MENSIHSDTAASPTPLGAVTSLESHPLGMTLPTGNGVLHVRVLAPDLIRLRALRTGQEEPDRSWAVAKTDWKDSSFEVREDGEAAILTTAAMSVRVSRADGSIRIATADGRSLMDEARIAWDGAKPTIDWSQPEERRVFGCGEKSGPLQRRGRPMQFWNTDHYAYGVDDDPLYKSIPFYVGMDGNRAHGVFFDNTFRQEWDLGDPGSTSAHMAADNGALDLYMFAGPTAEDVLDRYAELTGRMNLPSLWTLGFHQSRYSYYPDPVVRALGAEFRRRRIPCDVIYFDIHYMERFKVFTWDREAFPDPEGMLAHLRENGFHTVAILDPGVKVEDGYASYEELRDEGLYVRNPDGSPFIGPVWPGDCLFPDFTDPRGREWWGGQYAELVRQGMDGFWNDMNEPAVFEAEGHTMPPDTQFQGDGLPDSHLRYHNVYGSGMVQATYEGVRRLRPEKRAFVLTRAGYAGHQRFAATWTGDNVASWEHFRMSIPMVLNLGLSGQAISGPDIGGFAKDPAPELFARWMQAGALFPFCRVHHAATTHEGVFDFSSAAGQEPWSYGEEWTAINRASIELRYRLLPYLYTLFEEMTRTGLPILRPLFLEYPDDDRFQDMDDQFLVGSDLLAAPVLYEGATTRDVVLPAGTWYDFWTNEAIEGGRTITVEAPLQTLPLFVRAGSILPLQDVVQHTGEMAEVPIRWRIYPLEGEAEGAVYEDDGESMGYQTGEYRRTRVTAVVENGEARVTVETEGSYQSPRPEATFEVAAG